MKIQKRDLSKVLKDYSSKWIALKPDSMTVVASGDELRKVLEKARSKGVENPVMTRAPKNYGAYILNEF